MLLAKVSVSVAYFITLGCKGEEVTKYWPEFLLAEALIFTETCGYFAWKPDITPRACLSSTKYSENDCDQEKRSHSFCSRERGRRVKGKEEVEVVGRKSGARERVIAGSGLCDVTQIFKRELTEFQSAW